MKGLILISYWLALRKTTTSVSTRGVHMLEGKHVFWRLPHDLISTNPKLGFRPAKYIKRDYLTQCDYYLVLQRLIKMNMPIMGDSTVLFTSTLFALIRTALAIFSTGDPPYVDSELRKTIRRLWPKTSKKTLEKMIPLQSGEHSKTDLPLSIYLSIYLTN